jgi:hypothetical protein
MTVWRALRKLKITRKKKVLRADERQRLTSNGNAASSNTR